MRHSACRDYFHSRVVMGRFFLCSGFLLVRKKWRKISDYAHMTNHVQKILGRVKIGKTLAKWGITDEKILNRVIHVKNIKLGGKN